MTIHTETLRILSYRRLYADRIRRYSRASDAKEKAARLLREAQLQSVREAYAREDFEARCSAPRPGVDAGRANPRWPGSRWAGWLDGAGMSRTAGWQLYCVAVRDLVRRRFSPSDARDIAAQLTCCDRIFFVPRVQHTHARPGDVPIVPRPPEVTSDVDLYGWDRRVEGVAPDVLRAWSAWMRVMHRTEFTSSHAGKRTRRWLAVNAEIRAEREAARAAA